MCVKLSLIDSFYFTKGCPFQCLMAGVIETNQQQKLNIPLNRREIRQQMVAKVAKLCHKATGKQKTWKVGESLILKCN